MPRRRVDEAHVSVKECVRGVMEVFSDRDSAAHQMHSNDILLPVGQQGCCCLWRQPPRCGPARSPPRLPPPARYTTICQKENICKDPLNGMEQVLFLSMSTVQKLAQEHLYYQSIPYTHSLLSSWQAHILLRSVTASIKITNSEHK